MLYFDETADALLTERISSILSYTYYRQVEVTELSVSPLTAIASKAEKIDATLCLPKDIGDSTKTMTPMGALVISNNGYVSSDTVSAVVRTFPDDDIIDKICRLFVYVDLGDSRNVYSMITELSQELKNVASENLMEIRRHPIKESAITPWQM